MPDMREAVIVDAVRTPVGRRDGGLKSWHPVDLLAHTLKTIVQRNKLDPALVDDVIAGCVGQVGEQAFNVARNAVLAAGLPESVPGTTVDRQCGSSQQAAHFAAQGVIAGSYDIAIACGVECMTRVPMGSNGAGPGLPFGPLMMRRYNNVMFHQGIGAEMMAERWNVSRGELDAFSLESHRRAAGRPRKAGSATRSRPSRWKRKTASCTSRAMKEFARMRACKRWRRSSRHSNQMALSRLEIRRRLATAQRQY